MPLNLEQKAQLILLDRERKLIKARSHFSNYITYNSAGYKWNWHHTLMAEKLDAFVRGEITRLMLFLPPQNGKSEQGSRQLPSYIHGKFPDDAIMCMTYNDELANSMTSSVQRIMDTDRYRKIFPASRIMPEGTTGRYKRRSDEHELMPVKQDDGSWIVPRGTYRNQGVGGTFTGLRANWIIVDDPHKNRKDADSKAHRDAAWSLYTSTLRPRIAPNGRILVIMTRWHEDDLAGRLLEQQKKDPLADKWEIFSLQALKQSENPYDPREIGEALWPDWYPKTWLLGTKASIPPREWTSLYQQSPTPPEGHLFKRSQFMKRYREDPQELVKEMDRVILSCDLTFKDTKSSDYVALQVWGKKDSRRVMFDRINEKMGFAGTCTAINELKLKWPSISEVSIEDAANGAAAVEILTKKITGVVPWKPRTSKYARAEVVSPQFIAGNVEYPIDENAPWMPDYIEQLVSFPTAVHDDEVDSTTQALIVLGEDQSYDWSPISIRKESGYR